MPEYVFERCDPDSKDRCQAMGKFGQCPFKSLPESKYCPRHAGNGSLRSEANESRRLYALAQWQDRVGKQADHPKLKSLREEMGIMRMLLETRLNNCQDEQALLMSSGQITEMVREIAKTAKLTHSLEMSLNVVLDRPRAIEWVREIGNIIAKYVTDPTLREYISEEMLESLNRHTAEKQSNA